MTALNSIMICVEVTRNILIESLEEVKKMASANDWNLYSNKNGF